MEQIANIFESQKQFFLNGSTKKVEFRIEQLKKLKALLKDNEKKLFQAVYDDFKKPTFETYVSELVLIYSEIDLALKNVKSWAKPKSVSDTFLNFPSKNYIYPEPYGTVLIIGPWNYPINLLLMPLVGALAAGNTAVLKPSELTPNTSAVLRQLFEDHFDREVVAVVEGAVEETQALLKLNFDYIFFTGSTRVGQIVMEAAAKNLTPVTLELGGKSPAIVDHTADIEITAKRLAWGKFLNAGQTCVAPDYVYVHERVHNALIEAIGSSLDELFEGDAQSAESYARIVNEDHFDRLKSLLKDGNVYYGGQTDRSTRYIQPTILTGINWEMPVMQEEIFGPILPVLPYLDLNDVLDTVQSKPKPLALYVFTTDDKVEERILNKLSFGGGVVNDVVAHLANHELPFGGVGSSGMGAYHGKHSFDTFTHQKSVMKKSFFLDIPVRYPPYNGKLKWIKKLLR